LYAVFERESNAHPLADRDRHDGRDTLRDYESRDARCLTIDGLAMHAGMSRSNIALKFKATVGTSPMDYLTHWRMIVAADRLRHSENSISAIAGSLGYESIRDRVRTGSRYRSAASFSRRAT
jgi:AraC-like DNA-binding protein